MKKTVAHLLRKSTQFRASFIYNQVTHHREFRPVVIYASLSGKDDGGYCQADPGRFPSFHSGRRRNAFYTFLFRFFKMIGRRESESIIRFLKDQRVSALHLHYGTDAGIYWRVMRDSGIPAAVSFYGYDCSSFPRRFLGLGRFYLKRRVFPYAARVFAMSPDMKRDLEQLGCPPEKIVIHYHGIDVREFAALHRSYENKGKMILLIVSSLVPQKGHMFLLQTLKRYIGKKRHYDFELRIAGRGELEGELKDYVGSRGLEGHVRFIGAVPYGSGEMLKEYGDADIFVHPSVTAPNGDKEGIPGAVVEAMAAGLPVISTFHAGIPHVIENGKSGLLVHEWDIGALGECLDSLLGNDKLRRFLGENARRHARENLCLEIKEKELEEAYQR